MLSVSPNGERHTLIDCPLPNVRLMLAVVLGLLATAYSVLRITDKGSHTLWRRGHLQSHQTGLDALMLLSARTLTLTLGIN